MPIFPISPQTPSTSDREAAMSRTTISDLNACSKDDFVAALANIFEYSPWIAEHAAFARPFAGVHQLFNVMKAAVDRAPVELRLALIKAHPDLANKTQRGAGLTAESSAEQNSAGLDRLSDVEYVASQPRPRCVSLHVRPLGIFSRFADRGFSVFVIEGALPDSWFHSY